MDIQNLKLRSNLLNLFRLRPLAPARLKRWSAAEAFKFTLATVVAALCLLGCFHPATIQAQQTIFNVPTTDVLPRGGVYGEFDVSAKPVDPKFSSFAPRLVVGVGGDVEVGVNLYGNIQPGRDATTIVPAIKWRVYADEERGLAWVVGDNFYLPLRNRSYGAGNYFYTQFTKTFATKTRVGVGGYYFTKNVVAANAGRAGGQFSIEQPLTERFGITADWLTGRHAGGYLTMGGYFKFNRKLTSTAAYTIGNENASHGNHFFFGSLGYNFK